MSLRQNSRSIVCFSGLSNKTCWCCNLLPPNGRYLLQAKSSELLWGVPDVDVLGGFELDLQRRSPPRALHQKPHDVEAQPLVFGSQLLVTFFCRVSSAKAHQTSVA